MSPWREREAQPIGSMASLPGSSGHPLCGRTALRSLLLSAHGHQGGDTPQRPACFRIKILLNVKKKTLTYEKIRYFCVRRHACKTLLLFGCDFAFFDAEC